MTLSEIAEGLEVTATQRDRGVAVTDETDTPLIDRLREHAESLPCTPAATATLVEEYTAGRSVGEVASEAGVTPMTAAKALHRCGVAGICPLAPTRREVVREWLDGRISRSEAVTLAGGDEGDFALATYVETHEPIPELKAAVGGTLTDSVLGGGLGDTGSADLGAGTLGDALDGPDDLR